MPRSITTTFRPKDGRLPERVARQIDRVLELRGEAPTEIRVGEPVRTRKQDGTYFLFLERISLAYLDAGRLMPKDTLHRYFKALYLPAVKAEIERDTGEMIDIGPVYDYPDGTSEQDYSIKKLPKNAMAIYIDRIASDDDVMLMGVQVPTEESRYEEAHR